MNPLPIWRQVATLFASHSLLFLLASLLLAGTDFMLWSAGLADGAAARPNGAALAEFVAVKLVLLFVWALAALRLVDGPERPANAVLRLDGRQVRWLAGTMLALSLLFALRWGLTKAVSLILPEPRPALALGLGLYLVVSLVLVVRLLPGWAGVLLGDREASLSWSWRRTRGRVLPSAALVFSAVTPVLALHLLLNLVRLPGLPEMRAMLMVADGAVMALVVAVAMASYRALWLRAKAAP